MDERFQETQAGVGEERFVADLSRVLIEHARDIMLLMRSDGRIVLANHAAELAYGRSRASLATLNIRDLRAPSTLALMEEQMRAAMAEGLLFESIHLRADGTEFPVEVSSRGVVIEGEPHILSIIRDISSRKTREREQLEILADLEAANRQLEGLLLVVSSAVGRMELDPLVAGVLEALREAMDAQSALFFVLRDDRWVLWAQAGLEGGMFESFSMAADEGFASQVAAAGEVLWSSDVTATPAHIPVHDEYGIRAMLGVPLYVEGELFGVLECTWSEDRLVGEAERVMLQVAADRIMSAIVAAQRFEHTSRSGTLEAALAEASARLAASHELAETVPAALEVMLDAFGCDVAAFGSYCEGVYEVLYGVGIDPCRFAVPGHPGREAYAEGQTPVVRVEGSGLSGEWLRDVLGVAQAFIVPVKVRGEWFGALVFGRREPGTGFDGMTEDFARRFALVIALAYANADDFQVEHRIAETLQEALLKLEPEVPGVAFGHQYRSSALATRVGGDFYDVFEMGGGKVGVLIGDVSGKGLDAAVLTTVVRYTIRAFAHESDSPAEVVRKANAVLAGPARMPDFASVLFVVLDTASGHIAYCQAGHPPAVVVRADGSVYMTENGSPVIGAFTDVQYTESSLVLARGDLLVLYTDGVTEARDAFGRFFGEERLVQACVRAVAQNPETATRVIDEMVIAFCDGRPTDDIAIMVISLA